MEKALIRHGNSLAIVIDKPVLDLLQFTADTKIELTMNGVRSCSRQFATRDCWSLPLLSRRPHSVANICMNFLLTRPQRTCSISREILPSLDMESDELTTRLRIVFVAKGVVDYRPRPGAKAP